MQQGLEANEPEDRATKHPTQAQRAGPTLDPLARPEAVLTYPTGVCSRLGAACGRGLSVHTGCSKFFLFSVFAHFFFVWCTFLIYFIPPLLTEI